MSALAEIVKSILSRPLAGWAALAIAAGCALLLAHSGALPLAILPATRDLLAAGSLVVFLVASAFLVVLATIRVASTCSLLFARTIKRQRLRSQIKELTVEARAIIGLLVFRNQQSIWLPHNIAATYELREAKLMNLLENGVGSSHYELDWSVHLELQEDFAFLKELNIQQTHVAAIAEGEKAALERNGNSWMRY